VASHLPPNPQVAAEAAVHGYATAYWWGAAFFAFGAVLTAFLYRRRVAPVASAPGAAADGVADVSPAPEPVVAH
jgi:hypothetical protein